MRLSFLCPRNQSIPMNDLDEPRGLSLAISSRAFQHPLDLFQSSFKLQKSSLRDGTSPTFLHCCG